MSIVVKPQPLNGLEVREFLMLIDAYRMVLMSTLDYHMSVMNHMASQAALEQAVGMNIAEIAERVR